MPAPPAELTAASGALVYDGSSSRRALTTALLDLASRGELAFEQEDGLLSKKVSIRTQGTQPASEEDAARRRLNARKPLSAAEDYALTRAARPVRRRDVLADDDLLKFGSKVSAFNDKLEAFAVQRGWFAEAPGKVSGRWAGSGRARDRRRVHRPVRRLPDPVLGAGGPRRRADRGRDRHPGAGPRDAGPDDGRGDDPGDAGGLPADPREDDGPGPLDGAGRRRGQARLARDTRPGDGLGGRPRPPARGRDGPRAERRGPPSRGTTTSTPWFPAWYGTSQSFAGGGVGGGGGSVFSASAVPDFGGMFSALGSGRQLAVVVRAAVAAAAAVSAAAARAAVAAARAAASRPLAYTPGDGCRGHDG